MPADPRYADLADWEEGDGIRWARESWTAVVVLPSRVVQNPAGATTIYLEVELSDDEDDLVETDASDDDDEPAERWEWRFGISEEEAGFGEATFEGGATTTEADAKAACVEAFVGFCLGEGWTSRQARQALAGQAVDPVNDRGE
jgi:hypothetical protein